MNINAKIHNKTLAKWIKENIKKTTHHVQVSFIPQINRWSITTKLKKCNPQYKQNERQKPHYHLIRCRKALWQKTKHPFSVTDLESLETQGSFLNLVKAAYKKPIAHINLNMEKLKVKSTKISNKTRSSTLHIYSV